MSPRLQNKAAVLRKFEGYCYQIAYYVLEKEQEAVQAARETLLELGTDDSFFEQEEPEQQRRVRVLTMKQSLAARKTAYSAVIV
ncbi:hypothetical protein MJA45_21050 [Paenibacillus aurantius]|uniref:Uncharacterized protein n=1 Tax=Paenibacillus aurantius TaxID=2918900 RepID=A0AA96LAC7_9BACL|nr:hypothetical protein [Paenibacillus aurantius]WJH34859.1 hypothetical protein N6H14_01380 [Paenibacillus sp. CC-CFT747]WNQ10089.1 hypothetical protein MJA45_21050 [Paenibacillus aurantius]